MNATIGPTDYPSIDAFLDARASGDGSRHTLTSYRHDLIGFARWFAEHVPTEPGFAPEAVTPTDVRAFPTAVIARTVKGKGVSFMEHQLAWHYRSPGDRELALALAELDG